MTFKNGKHRFRLIVEHYLGRVHGSPPSTAGTAPEVKGGHSDGDFLKAYFTREVAVISLTPSACVHSPFRSTHQPEAHSSISTVSKPGDTSARHPLSVCACCTQCLNLCETLMCATVRRTCLSHGERGSGPSVADTAVN